MITDKDFRFISNILAVTTLFNFIWADIIYSLEAEFMATLFAGLSGMILFVLTLNLIAWRLFR